MDKIEDESEEILKRHKTIQERFEKAYAWRSLQDKAPETYEQFIKKVEQAADRKGYSPCGRSELLQLAWVLGWCEEHGIELSLFDLPGHLGNYREAASYIRRTISEASDEDEAREPIREAVTEDNAQHAKRMGHDQVAR